MSDLLKGLAILVLLPLGGFFLSIAWELWRMPEWRRRELSEHYTKRKHDEQMIRSWLLTRH